MSQGRISRFGCGVLGLWVLAGAARITAGEMLPDMVAPRIEHEPPHFVMVGQTIAFSAIVTDDSGVDVVSVYYRWSGTDVYERMPMVKQGQVYRVTVPLADTRAGTIEYYLQARDLAGNTLMRGYALSPLSIEVRTATAQVVPSNSDRVVAEARINTGDKSDGGEEARSFWGNKWVWIGAGLVLAAVAAGSGGDDESDDDPTGTVVVSAPLPE